MNKEDLNYEPFYAIQTLQIIDDPVESVKDFFKYDEEEQEITQFLQSSSLEDFIWVVIHIFKEEYGNGALLAYFLSDTSSKQEGADMTTYTSTSISRSDIKNLDFVYNKLDLFVALSFQFSTPLSNIHMAINDALNGKQYTFSNGKYTLEEDSGIEYIEANPSSFTLKANMDKAVPF